MPTPRVSVIIPVYNRASFVAEAVDSILAQTFEDFEIVIVDDGSQDGSPDLIRERYGDNPKISLVTQKNKGVAAARNTAIQHARGEYIALQDSDDVSRPDRLELQMTALDRCPEAVLCFGDILHNGGDWNGWREFEIGGFRDSSGFSLVMPRNLIPGPTVVMKKSAALEAGLFDESFVSYSDWELWIRMLAVSPAVCLNRILCDYRVHGEGQLTDSPTRSIDMYFRILEKNRELIAARAVEADVIYEVCYLKVHDFLFRRMVGQVPSWNAESQAVQRALDCLWLHHALAGVSNTTAGSEANQQLADALAVLILQEKASAMDTLTKDAFVSAAGRLLKPPKEKQDRIPFRLIREEWSRELLLRKRFPEARIYLMAMWRESPWRLKVFLRWVASFFGMGLWLLPSPFENQANSASPAASPLNGRQFSRMARSTNVAVMAEVFPVISETFIVNHITGLMDAGHRVDIIAQKKGSVTMLHGDVERYGLLKRACWLEEGRDRGGWLQRKFRNAMLRWAVLRTRPGLREVWLPRRFGGRQISFRGLYAAASLARTRHDILHVHYGTMAMNHLRFKELFPDTPFVVSFHGYDAFRFPAEQEPGVYRRLFEKADAFIANSQCTSNKLVTLGCPENKIVCIPEPLDLEKFPFHEKGPDANGRICILSVSRLVTVKGLSYAVEAAARVIGRHPQVEYRIIGDGPLKKELEKQIQDLGMEGRIQLLGALTQEETARAFEKAHLFMLTSVGVDGGVVEAQGLVLQEAQACGLPVLATRCGGIPEGMVDGKSGYLVPEKDVNALAEHLNELVEHPERWPAMGRAGRNFVAGRYDKGSVTERMASLYQSLLRGGNRSANA